MSADSCTQHAHYRQTQNKTQWIFFRKPSKIFYYS